MRGCRSRGSSIGEGNVVVPRIAQPVYALQLGVKLVRHFGGTIAKMKSSRRTGKSSKEGSVKC